MKKFALALVLTVAATTSCNKEVGFKPTSIAFATHPSVLRGTWSGTTTDNQALNLQLTATYDTPSHYQLSGTGSLDKEALKVTGQVVGGSLYTYLKAQLTPVPETAQLVLQRPGVPDLKLKCSSSGGNETAGSWSWRCFLPDSTIPFKLTRGNSHD